MTGTSFRELEREAAERLAEAPIDHGAMTTVGSLYRAAGAVRNRLERSILARHDLTWTGWMVLWVICVCQPVESHDAAAAAGISKSTMSGVTKTLVTRGLVYRRRHRADGRRVLLTLTRRGEQLIADTLGPLNVEEIGTLAPLGRARTAALADALEELNRCLEPGAAPA